MGIVVRQSVKGTIVTFIGALLGALITYIYTVIFSMSELGYVTNFVHQAALIQVFTLVGTSSLVGYYTPRYIDDDARQKVLLSFSALCTLGATLIFTLVYFLLKDVIIGKYQHTDQAYINKYYWCMPLLVLSWSFMTMFEAYLVSKHRSAIVAFMREVVARLLTLIFIILFYFNLISFDVFVYAIILCYLIPALALLLVAMKIKGFGYSLNFKIFNRSDYKEFIHFAWYHLLLVASVNFMGYIDIIMLGPLDKTGLSSLAVYSRAVFVISVMMIPYKAISSASFATLSHTFLDGDNNKLRNVFNRIGDNMMVAAMGMFCLIACNLDNAVRIFPTGYEAIKPLVLILMFGRMMDMATGMNNEVISISKYYKFNFRLTVLLVVCTIALMRYMIPIYGIYGAAWGATISLAAFNIVKALYLWKKLDLKPFTGATLRIIGAGAIAALAGLLIPYMGHWLTDTALRSIVIIAIYLGLLLGFSASPDLKDYLTAMKKNKKLY
jgi:Membrane protein involved in the export of O-antigen and teichoic acid